MQRDPIHAFADGHLGVASGDFVRSKGGAGEIRRRLAEGASESDAVLGAIFGQIWHDRDLAEDFFGYFLRRIAGVSVLNAFPNLRRLLDTGDLAQSVVADFIPRTADFEFRTEGEFLSYLVRQMKWRAVDRARSPDARRADLNASELGARFDEALELPDGPATRLVKEEERHAMLIAVFRLPERDRSLVRMHLAGVPKTQAMQELGLSDAGYRKALQRALDRIRAILSE